MAAFLKRYVEDRDGGEVKPLTAYQALFPGYEDVVAREYSRLEAARAATRDFSTLGLPSSVSHPAEVGAVQFSAGDPREIGPYKILELLGEGGMGVVYLAEQTEPIRRRVALKAIKLGMDTREVLARFESERQALALLNHPHIARVYDAGATDQGRPFFVMEHVPGIPLNRFCDQHEIDLPGRLEIFTQLCEAVQHAHQKGIIHRDLKPSNVLVSYEDSKPIAKIIDFGVAKSTNQRLTERTVFTLQGQIIGTPEYMSPEQAEMSPLDVDTRTDIYSLGVILYELLTGFLPFDPGELRQAGYGEIQRRIREVDPPTPSGRVSRLGASAEGAARMRRTDARSLARRLRGDLDWITMKAMEKDRARRYASASELAADVVRFLRHEPVSAGPPGISYRLRKLLKKYRVPIFAALSALLLLVATVVGERHLSSQRAYGEGVAYWNSYRELRGRLEVLEDKATVARGRLQSWQPVWERTGELDVLEDLENKQREAELDHDQALRSFYQAWHRALPWTGTIERLEERLSEMSFERYFEIRRGKLGLIPEVPTGLIGSLRTDTFRRKFEATDIELSSEPASAQVYCFRYESREGRMVPLPFDPRAGREDPRLGIIGEPALVVESVTASQTLSPPLRTGDRFLEVGGLRVRTFTEFAKALSSMAADQAVEVLVSRQGHAVSLSWVPFPAKRLEELLIRGDDPDDTQPRPCRAGRVVNILDQFGFNLSGYPLEFADECRVGVTGAHAPLTVRLPRGSYLLVLRKEGFLDTRFPVSVPREADTSAVPNRPIRLLREAEVPSGFVYVPEGLVCYGGDRGVDEEGLKGGARSIPGFLMGRLEVTVKEYLDFINHPEVSPTIDPTTGHAPSRSRPEKKVVLVPSQIARDPGSGRWQFKAGTLITEDMSILHISVEAAREYARWKTEECGGKWQFRLPSDLEWEKVARGMDRRAYVWGNDPILSFCRSRHAAYRCWPNPKVPGTYYFSRRPGPGGAYPWDESVFGIRDMAGSVAEPVEGRSSLGFPVLRGGSWLQPDAQYYRIANREGRATGAGQDVGIRLVADLPPP
ncbi:MAG: protein kinase [Planctomycetes bacterium]|nr:protein kinase [Planctomycetota bacterium]